MLRFIKILVIVLYFLEAPNFSKCVGMVMFSTIKIIGQIQNPHLFVNDPVKSTVFRKGVDL